MGNLGSSVLNHLFLAYSDVDRKAIIQSDFPAK